MEKAAEAAATKPKPINILSDNVLWRELLLLLLLWLLLLLLITTYELLLQLSLTFRVFFLTRIATTDVREGETPRHRRAPEADEEHGRQPHVPHGHRHLQAAQLGPQRLPRPRGGASESRQRESKLSYDSAAAASVRSWPTRESIDSSWKADAAQSSVRVEF